MSRPRFERHDDGAKLYKRRRDRGPARWPCVMQTPKRIGHHRCTTVVRIDGPLAVTYSFAPAVVIRRTRAARGIGRFAFVALGGAS